MRTWGREKDEVRSRGHAYARVRCGIESDVESDVGVAKRALRAL